MSESQCTVPPEVLIQPAFMQCLLKAASIHELCENFDRLNNGSTNMSMRGAPIELMVDRVTGRLHDSMAAFANFVYEFIYTRLPANCFTWKEIES